MNIIRTGTKGTHLNTLKKCHIYKISRNNLHMNDAIPYFRQYMHTTKKDIKKRTITSNESIQGIHAWSGRATHKGNM
jgi:hypothetical protein